jgi:hypothetical protein
VDPYRPPDDADFDNPYAPPKSAFEPERPVYSGSLAIPFSVDSIASTSWSIYRDNLGTCLWVVWSVMLVNFGLALGLNGLMAGLQAAMPGNQSSILIIYWTFYLFSILLQTWLGIGMNLALIKVARGEHVAFDQLFSGGRYMLRVIFGAIVMMGIFFGIMFVPLILMGVAIAALRDQAAWGLVALVVCVPLVAFLAIYLSARLMQFYFLIIDRDSGVMESLQGSWQITRGRVGTLILVYLLQLVLAIGGILALCVGFIFTLPLSNLMQVVTYLALVGTGKPLERIQFSNWDDDLQPA